MRPQANRHKVNDTRRYARKTPGRDRPWKDKHRPEGKFCEGRGRKPRLGDVWPETD